MSNFTLILPASGNWGGVKLLIYSSLGCVTQEICKANLLGHFLAVMQCVNSKERKS